MSTDAKTLIEAYDRLSEGDRREVAREILRRAVPEEVPPLDVEALDRLADEVFADLDAREAADGRP